MSRNANRRMALIVVAAMVAILMVAGVMSWRPWSDSLIGQTVDFPWDGVLRTYSTTIENPGHPRFSSGCKITTWNEVSVVVLGHFKDHYLVKVDRVNVEKLSPLGFSWQDELCQKGTVVFLEKKDIQETVKRGLIRDKAAADEKTRVADRERFIRQTLGGK